MAANVETMFSVREKPWHGLGEIVEEAPTVEDAIRLAGLDWKVVQSDVFDDQQCRVPGFKLNIRETDRAVLGLVSDRYKVLQNADAFAFGDELLGKGVKFETAGSLAGGRRNFILARMPEGFKILDDEIEPYMVLTNSHDGSSGVTVAMTPIRVVCQNTLNFALSRANRKWSARHMGNLDERIEEARETLELGKNYLEALKAECEQMNQVKFSDDVAEKMVKELIPVKEDASERAKQNAIELQTMLMQVYKTTDDLQNLNKGAYRFVNAVSDFATHREPKRNTETYKEKTFISVIGGMDLIDKAFKIVNAR